MTTESTHARPSRHIVKALDEMVWAITPAMLATIQEIAGRRLAGERLDPTELEHRLADSHHGHEFAVRTIEYELASGRGGEAAGGGQIAVLPIYGVIMPRATLFSSISGGTSVEQVMAAFKRANADPNVGAILLDIDSPGGSSDLIAELGQLIYDARGGKPIAAIANTDAGSAACWIACQCDEVAVTPSGKIGSIGVYGTHTDVSAANEMEGIKPTTIQYGKYKTELSPNGPLTPEAITYVQGMVDDMGAMFTEAVARGRGVSAATVGQKFGEGRMLTAKDAVKAGLADRVATYDQMVARLARGQVKAGKPSGTRVDAEPTRITLDALEPEAAPVAPAAATDPLAALLQGAHATALAAGNTDGPIVIQLDEQLTPAHLEHLAERLAPFTADLGRKFIVLPKGATLSDADAIAATREGLPAAAGEEAQPAGPSGQLHRRAVRAALRTAAESREGGITA